MLHVKERHEETPVSDWASVFGFKTTRITPVIFNEKFLVSLILGPLQSKSPEKLDHHCQRLELITFVCKPISWKNSRVEFQ